VGAWRTSKQPGHQIERKEDGEHEGILDLLADF